MSKTSICIRLDKEVVDWFRQEFPAGYQTGINNVLLGYVRGRVSDLHVRVGRAQELYRRYWARCFWHLRKDLKITAEHVPLVIAGLRKHGGREGYLMSADLERLNS